MNFKKKIGKILTSKSAGTGPWSYEKRIYRAAVSQRLRNTVLGRPKEDRDRQTGRSYLPKIGLVNIPNRAQLALFDYPDWGPPHPGAFFPQLQAECQGITRKDGPRPRFFPGKAAKFHRES